MKAENRGNEGFLQRESVEHQGYAEARSTDRREGKERDGASGLLEAILDRDNLNRAYKRVKSNHGAAGIDGMSVEEALPWIKEHIRGWLGYFHVAEMKRMMKSWDEWLRRRFRMYIWKQWKKPRTKVTNLRKLGIPADKAYQWGNSRLGYWRIAGSPVLECSITNERLEAAGYFSILNCYECLHSCD